MSIKERNSSFHSTGDSNKQPLPPIKKPTAPIEWGHGDHKLVSPSKEKISEQPHNKVDLFNFGDSKQVPRNSKITPYPDKEPCRGMSSFPVTGSLRNYITSPRPTTAIKANKRDFIPPVNHQENIGTAYPIKHALENSMITQYPTKKLPTSSAVSIFPTKEPPEDFMIKSPFPPAPSVEKIKKSPLPAIKTNDQFEFTASISTKIPHEHNNSGGGDATEKVASHSVKTTKMDSRIEKTRSITRIRKTRTQTLFIPEENSAEQVISRIKTRGSNRIVYPLGKTGVYKVYKIIIQTENKDNKKKVFQPKKIYKPISQSKKVVDFKPIFQSEKIKDRKSEYNSEVDKKISQTEKFGKKKVISKPDKTKDKQIVSKSGEVRDNAPDKKPLTMNSNNNQLVVTKESQKKTLVSPTTVPESPIAAVETPTTNAKMIDILKTIEKLLEIFQYPNSSC